MTRAAPEPDDIITDSHILRCDHLRTFNKLCSEIYAYAHEHGCSFEDVYLEQVSFYVERKRTGKEFAMAIQAWQDDKEIEEQNRAFQRENIVQLVKENPDLAEAVKAVLK